MHKYQNRTKNSSAEVPIWTACPLQTVHSDVGQYHFWFLTRSFQVIFGHSKVTYRSFSGIFDQFCKSEGMTYLSNFDFLLECIAFSMDTNLFSFCSIDTVQTSSTIVFSLTWNTFATCFSFLKFSFKVLFYIESRLVVRDFQPSKMKRVSCKNLPFDSCHPIHRACHRNQEMVVVVVGDQVLVRTFLAVLLGQILDEI